MFFWVFGRSPKSRDISPREIRVGIVKVVTMVICISISIVGVIVESEDRARDSEVNSRGRCGSGTYQSGSTYSDRYRTYSGSLSTDEHSTSRGCSRDSQSSSHYGSDKYANGSIRSTSKNNEDHHNSKNSIYNSTTDRTVHGAAIVIEMMKMVGSRDADSIGNPEINSESKKNSHGYSRHSDSRSHDYSRNRDHRQ